MSTGERRHFAARIGEDTVVRVRWLASRDLSKAPRVGETVDELLTEALDARGVPRAAALLSGPHARSGEGGLE